MKSKWSPLLSSQEAKSSILRALEILESASKDSGDLHLRFDIEKEICHLLDLVDRYDIKGWPEA